MNPTGTQSGNGTQPGNDVMQELTGRFGEAIVGQQATKDNIPTIWVKDSRAKEVLAYLKQGASDPYRMLYDLTAIDERLRRDRAGQPDSTFTLVYHLLSPERNSDVRIKVPLAGEHPTTASVTDIWRSADWYEREAWDMFGIHFDGHPNLRRILMPATWIGHPLRKEHPARATDMGPFFLPDDRAEREEEALRFHPDGTKNVMVLNMGPHHPGTHGLLRIILELDGEQIVNVFPDIGFHHRAAEKMGERQTWHTYIPYTDRVDYLAGVLNNFPYLLAVEALAAIDVPDRAKVIRIMIAELFRIANHLVYYGTFSQDLGAMSPVFFMFNDRERIFYLIEAICGGRMHPEWFRIGGVAMDLPKGWDTLVRDFITFMPPRLKEYDSLVLKNRIFRSRTKGIGRLTVDDAIDRGITGPNLRACGLQWDVRKERPYSGYDQFEFDIPTLPDGDCLSRAIVRVDEMRQSLKIIEQCLNVMPAGPYISDHPLATPPSKDRTLCDIETLIKHFLSVSWGPVIPAGEAAFLTESAKGNTSYYLISDGGPMSYRTRIRTPSFAHLQAVPFLARGLMIADLIAILGSIDYVLADVDR